MTYSRLSIIKRLSTVREAVSNVKNDPYLKDLFAENGFTEDRLDKGLAMEQVARDLQIGQQVEYGSRLEASGVFVDVFDRVRETLRKDRTVAKTVLEKKPGLYEQLALKGRLKQRREEVIQQALHFYREIQHIEEVRLILEQYALTPEVLAARLQDVNTLQEARHKQLHQRGEAQVATRRRREAMAELDNWFIQFAFVAKRILQDDKEQLEKLGIVVN